MGLFSVLRGSTKKPDEFQSKFFTGKKLGAGAYGEVFEAIRKEDGGRFAVKIIQKARLKGEYDSVVKEIDILKKLDHPNIISLIDMFESDSQYYLVIQLATGGELFDRILQKGSYTEIDAAKLVKQLLNALVYLHDKVNIIHRDLKPENLLFRDPGEYADLVVTDFGLSRHANNELLTTSCGSPSYIAPEVLNSMQYGKSVDMWATGVITFVLLCGYTPFWGGESNSNQVMYQQIMLGKYDLDPQYWDCISSDAKDFIAKLLVVDPARRMTAQQALEHAWLSTSASVDLLPNVRLNFNAKRTFKKGIFHLISCARYCRCGQFPPTRRKFKLIHIFFWQLECLCAKYCLFLGS